MAGRLCGGRMLCWNRGIARRRLDGVIRGAPACHANKPALKVVPNAGASGGAGAIAARDVTSTARHHFDAARGNQRLRQKRAARVPHIEPDALHKAVDLLRDLEKSNGAKKPDQHLSYDRFFAGRRRLRLHLAFCDGEGRGGKKRPKKERQTKYAY